MFLKTFKPIDSLASFLNLGVLLASLFLLFFHKNLPSSIPLWFSKTWGLERLSPNIYLWLIPLLILSAFLINNLLAKILLKTHYVLAKILVWSSTLIGLVLLFSLYKIILTVI